MGRKKRKKPFQPRRPPRPLRFLGPEETEQEAPTAEEPRPLRSWGGQKNPLATNHEPLVYGLKSEV